MNECKLYQEFTYVPNTVLDEGFDIYIRVSISNPADENFGYSKSIIDHFLVTVYDEEQAKSFVNRLNNHWDDIYEVPRWCKKFFEIHGNMNGEVEILGI